MLRALCLVVAHDLLEYRYMDDVTGNLFSLFCLTWQAIDYLTMPKLQEIFTTVAIVCLRYERLAVLQNVFAIILL